MVLFCLFVFRWFQWWFRVDCFGWCENHGFARFPDNSSANCTWIGHLVDLLVASPCIPNAKTMPRLDHVVDQIEQQRTTRGSITQADWISCYRWGYIHTNNIPCIYLLVDSNDPSLFTHPKVSDSPFIKSNPNTPRLLIMIFLWWKIQILIMIFNIYFDPPSI